MHEKLSHARAQFESRDYAAAEREARAVLQDEEGNPAALDLLGQIHIERHEYDEAQEVLLRATHPIRPFPSALARIATVCNLTGRHRTALAMSDLALVAEPGHAEALIETGIALRALGQYAHAKDALVPMREHSRAMLTLAETLLREGDLARGLPLLEKRRLLRPVGVGLTAQEWNGEPRAGARLLVLPEPGLSNFLLMSRFLPTLADRFAHVVVLAPGPLARLVQSIDPRLEVVCSLPDARYDLWTCIVSLPLRLGVRRTEDLPTAPWIHAEAEVAPARDGRVRIGINWAGDPSHPRDRVRSAPLRSLSPLLEVQEIEWVSLHRGTRQDEAKAFALACPLEHATDFLDTARVVAGLDFVVSTESAVAHLALAMGVPTCVLSPQDAHWSWPHWYAGVTLCPQREAGNWNGPMSDVAGVLLALPAAA